MGITMPEGHMEEYIDILSLLDGVHRSVISQPANLATPIRSELVDDDGNVIGNAADWMLTEEREFNTNFSIVSKHISAPFTEVSSVPVSVVQRSDTVITHADYLVSGLPMIDATFDSPSMMIYAVAKMIHRTYIGLVIPDGVGYKYSIIDSTGTVVHDNVINPTITPRPNWGALPFFTDPGATATDFEDGNLTPNIVITNNTLQYTQPEVKTFDYDVSDSEGLIDSGTRVVTTRAQTAPYIQIHYGLTANLHQTVVMEKASTPLFNDPGYVGRTANDNDITASVNVSSNLVNTQMAGFYQRQYTLTDTTGLTSDFKRSVIVYELFPPVLTLLGDNPLSIAAGVPAQWNEPGYTAIDPEDGVITPNVIITGDTVDVDTAGVYNVIYTITDSDGLSDTETRVVNVTAAVFPVITLLGDQNEIIPRHSQPQEFFYKIHARVHGANPWTAHTVLAELDVLDGSGNSMVQAPFTSGTTLVDNVPPVFDGDNLTEGWIHQPGNFLDEPGFTFRSTSDMIPPKTITMTAPMAYGGTSMPPTHLLPFFRRQPRGLPIPVVGWSPITLDPSAQVTWTPGSVNTITYADNILSAFRSPNHNSYNDPGFTAYDAIDGYITANVTQTVTTWVDLFTPGTYLNTYTVTNSSGNTHTITRTTVVIPYDDPVLTMQGDNPLRMNDGATFVDPGCTAIKGDGGNIVVTYTSGVHELEDGTFAYFYGATDLFGNTGVAIRVIEINEPPWIEIQGANPLELIPDDGDLWVDPGAIATDTEDGDLTASIVVTGDNFDDQVPGTYYVVYTVTDSDGESDSATRVVEVLDIF